MIVLHHLNNSRSQRILWLLEELGLDYRIERYQRDKKTMLAPDSLKRIHPLGKSPLLEIDGRILAESGAIVDYLCRVHGGQAWSVATGDPAYQDYCYWLHFAEGSMMPPMLLKLVLDKIRDNAPLLVLPVAAGIVAKVNKAFVGPNLSNNLGFVEQQLAGKDWFLGDTPSGADIQMSFPLEAAVARGLVNDQHPNIQAYVKRIHARPAYQRALEKGGEYQYA